MNLAIWLWRVAQRTPDKTALFQGTTPLASFRELKTRCASIANALHQVHGIQRGDRVALFLANHPDYLTAILSIWTAGGVVVPINANLHAREAAWIICDAGAKLVLTDRATSAALADIEGDVAADYSVVPIDGPEFEQLYALEPLSQPVDRHAHDLAWLFYTSGTTGRPKGVMLSNSNLQAMAYAYLADVDHPTSEDAYLYAAPMSHGAGLYIVPHLLCGSSHIVPASGGFDPAEILALGRHFGSLSFFAAPTIIRRLVDHADISRENGEGLRTIVYGGGPMYVADIQRAVKVLGPRFVQIYGQGESPMTITTLSRAHVADQSNPRWVERVGSVGTSHSCVEVRIVDTGGNEVPIGQPGEIIVRGATVMLGYWNNPDASAAALHDGWLQTGDIGQFDNDGFLTLKDRSKDVIISGGVNIYPREVEEALLTHPEVVEACVLGRPNAEWGEEVVAFVVARKNRPIDPASLGNHCLERIGRFKRPKHYYFVETLPKNSHGKVVKAELRLSVAAEENANREETHLA